MDEATRNALWARVNSTLTGLGPVWAQDIPGHMRQVVDAYTPLVAAAPQEGIQVTRDVAYGPHPRQILDLFQPDGARRAPVVMFVHGGAFVRGQKSLNGIIYDNVPAFFARHGYLGVNVEFRLAPESTYPGGAADLALAVEWVRRSAADYGGDPGRIFLLGHSAGGCHVATYAFDPIIGTQPVPEIRGLILVGARVRADTHPDNPNAHGVRAYFGDDPALYEERSPVTWTERSTLPVLVAAAEFENPYLDVYAAELYYRLSRMRQPGRRFVQLPGHNHTSAVAHLNSGDDRFGRQMLDFLAEAGGFHS